MKFMMTPLQRRLECCLFALMASAVSHAADVTWDGSESSDWADGLNWDNGTGPVEGDVVYIPSGDVVFDDGVTLVNLRALRQLGGTLMFAGGEFKSTYNASWDSHVEGTVYHTGTDVTINELEVGRTSGDTGVYSLSGGSLNVSRGLSGYSLFLGGNKSGEDAGTGTMEISGGGLTTRSGVKLGDGTLTGTGHFSVLGSAISEIGIADSNTDTDGTWVQHDGCVLTAGIDYGGITPIVIHDSSTATGGTSATFESGSLLNVGYFSTFNGGGTWTLMEVENGDIIDNGLQFAAGVDTSLWSFNIDNTGTNGVLTVTSSSTASVDINATWTGAEDTLWENPHNWDNNFGAVDDSYVFIPDGTIDYTTASESGINLRGFRMTGGTLNLSSGDLDAGSLASGYSQMDGAVFQTGGSFGVNALEIGRASGSTGSYELSAGELRIGRAKNGYSLYLGANSSSADAGEGTLTISGGSFVTRTSVKLGAADKSGTGRFVVLGTDATEIGIGSANDDSDGTWEQYSGSTLEVGIDFGGVTPIFIKDSDTNTNGTSATFASGSLLDVDYHNITSGGGTWTVMEVENGDIIDEGLQFAPGVDTGIWSFSVDNSGSNGLLRVTASGRPLGYSLTVGSTLQQKMRYGMDYERLWYWSSNLNSTERDEIARWTTVDAAVDFVRVAVNSGYELTEGTYDLSAYTSKIIPLMEEMQQANPDVKFYASPRPLNEAVSNASWQPYPIWVTGAPSYTSSDFDFDWQKCSEYLVRYLLLMKSYGFKISFLDITNEWQSNVVGGRVTQDDLEHIYDYLNETYMADPWPHPALSSALLLEPEDIPQLIAPSSWNYSQGSSWIGYLDSGDREAISIAACHNTDRTGDAQSFADTVREDLGDDIEIWNTEVHGWKSTSSENETTSFYYYIEAIRAGFSGINGWLAIGTTNQGHSYILNPGGTPTRNVKYYIYRKLSSTSNYGNALNIVEEPSALTIPLDSNDDDIPRNVAAFIKGNLMTVWVVNESSNTVPIIITPSGHTIAETNVRRTRWTDPADVEGFETYEPVTSSTSVASSIPAESVCCFEIVLGAEDFANEVIEVEDYSHQWGTGTEDHTSYVNLSNVNHDDFTRYGDVALTQDSVMSFSVARPAGRPDGIIEIREGSSEGPLLGQVAVPETGNWQSYETVTTALDVDAGIYNLYLVFTEDAASPTGNYLFNVDWFSVNDVVASPAGLTAVATGPTGIDLSWSGVRGATGYQVMRSTVSGGPYSPVGDELTATAFSDTGLTPGTPYFYVVTALYDTVESDDSNEATATTIDALPPTGLAAVIGSATEVTLSWDAMAGAGTYQVKRATTSGGAYEFVGTSSSTGYNVSGLTPGTRYYFVVSAVYDTTESNDSLEVSVVPSDPIIAENVAISSISIGSDGNGGQEWTFAMDQSGLGQFHQLMATEDLDDPVWIPVGPVELGTGGLLEIELPYDSAYERRFFKIAVWRE